MRIADWVRVGAIALAIAFGGAAAARGAEVIDRVLAVAAGQVITLSDVTAARDLGLQTVEASADPVRSVLTRLIDRELMLAEVERYGPPEPAADLVERELTTVRERFPSASAYEATLARSGWDEKRLRDMLRQELRLRAYLDQRFTPADPRRVALIDEWVAGLRRRGNVVDVYLSGK